MERKTIFLELSSEVVDRIDKQNNTRDRSAFISNLINKQLDQMVSTMDFSTDLTSSMKNEPSSFDAPGELKILNGKGMPVGNFNINTVEDFERLSSKICEISNDPIVRMRARRWR